MKQKSTSLVKSHKETESRQGERESQRETNLSESRCSRVVVIPLYALQDAYRPYYPIYLDAASRRGMDYEACAAGAGDTPFGPVYGCCHRNSFVTNVAGVVMWNCVVMDVVGGAYLAGGARMRAGRIGCGLEDAGGGGACGRLEV